MVTATRTPAPSVTTDLELGGRWTSLRLAGREWLWQRHEPARRSVRPGDPFIDAGGLEECIPTVRGTPDHGHAWSRAWRRVGSEDVVDAGEFTLRRRMSFAGSAVVASYRLEAQPGYRFVWAAHALLDLSAGALLSLPHGLPVRVYPEAAPLLDHNWPGSVPYVVGTWPHPCGLALSQIGPDDGTAVGATVVGTGNVEVIDGGSRLRMRIEAESFAPLSVAIWRNLGGFPARHPYRSIGVEPMLGRVFDLAGAGPDDAVTVPQTGAVSWQLHIAGSSGSTA